MIYDLFTIIYAIKLTTAGREKSESSAGQVFNELK